MEVDEHSQCVGDGARRPLWRTRGGRPSKPKMAHALCSRPSLAAARQPPPPLSAKQCYEVHPRYQAAQLFVGLLKTVAVSLCIHTYKAVYNESVYAKLSSPPIHAERASRATLSRTTRFDSVASSRDSCETCT